MKISVALPTRGLVFARTLKSLKNNNINLDLVFTISGLPIPDCHNEAVRIALRANTDWILLLEDDIELPKGVIKAMLKTDGDIIYCDYPMDNGSSTVCQVKNKVYWGGLGCTLIKKEVFKKIGEPYFTCNYSWRIERNFKLTKVKNPNKYGGHDINFGMEAQRLGFKLVKVKVFEAKHLRCQNLTKPMNNKGIFKIQSLERINIIKIIN